VVSPTTFNLLQKLNPALEDLAYAPNEEDCTSHPCAELPPLMALCELRVGLGHLQIPPRWSAHLITAITSAPVLSSVHFGFGMPPGVVEEEIERCASDDRWILIDRWLSHLAKGHGQCPALAVVLSIPFDGGPPKLRSFLSECRGAGVEVVLNSC